MAKTQEETINVCGSNRKYKNCCLDKSIEIDEEMAIPSTSDWFFNIKKL
ncbi:MAG: SEC-C domain-containing protein [Rickettsiales bacterium]|jgi:hypothetical protein|nr:SEC-C domain-containing protein [Rickettsiales bacterium]